MRYYRKRIDANYTWTYNSFIDILISQSKREYRYLRSTARFIDEGPSGFYESYLRNVHNLYELITQ